MSEINFIETSAKDVLDTVLTDLENGVTEPLYPGDERRIYGEALAQLIVAVYNTVNEKCRERLLRYARGSVLDALGENRDTTRLEATLATTTLRFGIEAPMATNIIIPAGLRVTGDFTHYFLTDETVVLPAGSLYVQVTASAEYGGEEYNGIAAGEVKNIVDISEVPMIDYVTNIDETNGGGDSESDDAYRERIRESENKLSTAGPSKAYRYWAISANPRVSDAVVESEKEIEIELALLCGDKFFIGGDNCIAETLVVYKPDGTIAKKDSDYVVIQAGIYMIMVQVVNPDMLKQTHIKYEIARNMYGRVKIVPICAGGELPDEDILADVLAACSASDVRPLTDMVVVEAPSVENYDIELTYYTTKSSASSVIENIEGDGGAIDQYIYWQDSNIDQDINPDKLRSFILSPTDVNGNPVAGANRVEIVKPVYTELSSTTVAKFSGNLVVNHVVKG